MFSQPRNPLKARKSPLACDHAINPPSAESSCEWSVGSQIESGHRQLNATGWQTSALMSQATSPSLSLYSERNFL